MNNDLVRTWQKIQLAERQTGITGQPTADATYVAALKQMGMDTAGLIGHANAARAIFDAVKNKRTKPRLATDANTISARNVMFPNANRLNGF